MNEIKDTIRILENRKNILLMEIGNIEKALVSLRAVGGEEVVRVKRKYKRNRVYKTKGERMKSSQSREAIFELLSHNHQGLQTHEIANRLNMSYQKVLYLLRSLEGRKRVLREGFKRKGGYVWKAFSI